MLSGQYSEAGFEVVADNSLDLLVGTQAASAGMISANVRHIGDTFHADFGKIQSTITSQAQMMSDVNRHGFETINTALHSQTDTLTKTVDQGVGQIDQTINTGMDRVDADVADLTGIAATSVRVLVTYFGLF